jgi:hypothetical protein
MIEEIGRIALGLASEAGITLTGSAVYADSYLRRLRFSRGGLTQLD